MQQPPPGSSSSLAIGGFSWRTAPRFLDSFDRNNSDPRQDRARRPSCRGASLSASNCQIVRHADKPPMNHHGSILCQPNYLAFNGRANGWVEFAQSTAGPRTYFDSVGHGTWRGSHTLNWPAKSWRRASRNSATICGFCAVNQSSSSSRVSTDESTDTGISTVSLGM